MFNVKLTIILSTKASSLLLTIYCTLYVCDLRKKCPNYWELDLYPIWIYVHVYNQCLSPQKLLYDSHFKIGGISLNLCYTPIINHNSFVVCHILTCNGVCTMQCWLPLILKAYSRSDWFFLFILKVANIRCFILIKCSEQEARFKK